MLKINLKDSEVKQKKHCEMSGKKNTKITVLWDTFLKKQPPRNVKIPVLKSFRKLPRVLICAIKNTPPHVLLGNSLECFRTAEIGTPPDGCF